jgi:hypothetical protein
MEEAVVVKEEGKEKRKGPEPKRIPLRIVKTAEVRTEHGWKYESSVISIAEANVKMESSPSMQPLLIRIGVTTPRTLDTTLRGEAISIKEGELCLERKPIEKKGMISISEKTPPVIAVTPSVSVKKEIFQVLGGLEIKVTPIELTFKPKTKPLKLEREVELAKEGAPLKLAPIKLPDLKIVELIKVRAQEKGAEEASTVTVEEESQLLEGLYELHKIITRGLGAVGAFHDRPICIILPKPERGSYVCSTALICRELYRMGKGGKPEVRWLSEGSKGEIEECMKAGDMIFVIDDLKCKLLPVFDKIRTKEDLYDKVRESKLFDRLHELFSQDLGFIIFHVSERWLNEFAEMLEEEAPYIPRLIKVPLLGLHNEVERQISSICWGFVEVEGENLDELFVSAEKNYYEALKSAYDDIELKHWIDLDPNAGNEHEATKIIVAEAIAKELGARNKPEVLETLRRKLVKTEHKLDGGVADLYLTYPDGKERYIEIETLYGTSDPITKKLDKETLNKYKVIGKSFEVSIVLLGLHLLLYIKDLIKLKRIYKERHGLNVDFFTVDIKGRRLVPMKAILQKLKELNLYTREGMSLDEAKRAFKNMIGRELNDNEVKSYYFDECKKHYWKIPPWLEV